MSSMSKQLVQHGLPLLITLFTIKSFGSVSLQQISHLNVDEFMHHIYKYLTLSSTIICEALC